MPVDELDDLVIHIAAAHLVLGIPWLQTRSVEFDLSRGQLLYWEIPVGNSRNEQTISALPEGDGCVEHSSGKPPPPAVDMRFVGATIFEDVLASNQVARAYATWNENGMGQLGAWTMSEDIALVTFCEGRPSWYWMGMQAAATVLTAEGGRDQNPD